MKFRWMVPIYTTIAVVALLFTSVSTLKAAQADSPAIAKLLAQAKTEAVAANNDAATLESFTRSKLAWQTHAAELERMRTHVNELGKTVGQLNDIRSEGSPWQQEAIDRINPLLTHLGDQLTATIKHLNDNQGKIHMQPYRDYTQANSELASRTATVISDFVEYGRAKSKAESLEEKLELPAAGGQ